uniref:Hematopoietic cell signal transducer n=1 Tax=Sus scrofa TaxID=9823 RepID=A0A4X1TCZ9_PIG
MGRLGPSVGVIPLKMSQGDLSVAQARSSCSGCGPLSLPLLAGLVAADAVVSLLIVVGVLSLGRGVPR